jgi:hypothetical protein
MSRKVQSYPPASAGFFLSEAGGNKRDVVNAAMMAAVGGGPIDDILDLIPRLQNRLRRVPGYQ